jgi:hypothetical protein
MFGHILTNTGPERDRAIEAFNGKLKASAINYDDLRLSNSADDPREMIDQLRRERKNKEEAFARASERLKAAEAAEARVRAAKKKDAPVTLPDPAGFAATDFTRHVDPDRLEKMKESMLWELGRGHVSSVKTVTGNRTVAHDLPFGAIVIEALKRFKVAYYPAGTRPTKKAFLKRTFGCSPQWAYRCKQAWEIVNTDDWPQMLLNFPDGATISVDEIVKWERKWNQNGDDKPEKRTMKQRYNDLRKVIQNATTLDDVKAFVRSLEKVK